MNADSISYEHEEDGVWMLLTLDEGYVLRVRVQDCAEQLYDRTKAAIGPWLRERDEAKAEYDRAQRSADTRNLSDEEFSAYLDDAYGDDWSKREGMSQMREQGYA